MENMEKLQAMKEKGFMLDDDDMETVQKMNFLARVQIAHARAIRKKKVCEDCAELLDPTNVEYSPFVVLCKKCHQAISEEYSRL